MWEHDWKPTQKDWDKIPYAKTLTQRFIEKAHYIHGDLYNYSLVNYKRSNMKVCIIDPDFGIFHQTPNSHLMGHGSPQRANNKKLTTEEFIKKAKLVHNNKFDYSLVEYINANTQVRIINQRTNEIFYQTPYIHLRCKG